MSDIQVVLEIPHDWSQAVRLFWDIEQRESIPSHVWEQILEWLAQQRFNESNYIAGETAAILIRNRAPVDVAIRLVTLALATQDEWLCHFAMAAERVQGTVPTEVAQQAAKLRIPSIRERVQVRLVRPANGATVAVLDSVETNECTLESIIQHRIGGRIDDLRVVVNGQDITLYGIAFTYYAKQQATKTALRVAPGSSIKNEIVVE